MILRAGSRLACMAFGLRQLPCKASGKFLCCELLTRGRSYRAEKLLVLQCRAMVSVTPDKNLHYQDIIKLTRDQSVILIDVREPHELQETGTIPGFINIPLNDVKAALTLPPEEFKKKFGISHLDHNASLIFSCRSGNRSAKAMQAALELGYQNSKHYAGGYLDWEKNAQQS